jgi:hypothetical protein
MFRISPAVFSFHRFLLLCVFQMGNVSSASLVADRVLHAYNASFLPAQLMKWIANAYVASRAVGQAVSDCATQRKDVCQRVPASSQAEVYGSVQTCHEAVEALIEGLPQLHRDMPDNKGTRALVSCFGREQCLVQVARELAVRCGTLYSHVAASLSIPHEFYKLW